MNTNVFRHVPLKERSFFQRLLNQQPDENAIIELNNLLARLPPKEIRRRDVETLGVQYKIDLEKDFRLNLEEFYAVYLAHSLTAKSLSDTETANLLHLKRIFSLSEQTVENLHLQIVPSAYQRMVEEAIADGYFGENEKAALDKLANDFQLPQNLTSKISAEVRTDFLQKTITRMVEEQRFSPAEERELRQIALNLNVALKMDEATNAKLEKLKLYWALENTDLPAVQVDIALQRGEVCFIKIQNVKWYELRSVRQRTTYSGYSTNFRVAKGFYLRSGSYTPRSYSVDQMTLIDTGGLYLTNKRIIFTGSKKNSNIILKKILNIVPYLDGLEVGKETGKTPSIQFPNRADEFCIILERLMRER